MSSDRRGTPSLSISVYDRPDENQKADAWKFDYRLYHDLFVYENKVKGIYLHRGSTAL